MKLTDVVEKLRPFSWAYIDTGFRQGRNAVLKRYQEQFEQTEEDSSRYAEEFLSMAPNAVIDFAKRLAPYDIPEDYIYFLEYYGGLAIDGDRHYFSLYGIGPMVESWYGYMNSGDHVYMEAEQQGWLSLGSLVFREGHKYSDQRVRFFLDLAGTVQRYSVIGIGPWDGATPRAINMLSDLYTYPGMWKKLANSFTEFLEQAAETRGAFAY